MTPPRRGARRGRAGTSSRFRPCRTPPFQQNAEGAGELIERVELHGAEVEVEWETDLLDGPLQDRLELRQPPRAACDAIDERHPARRCVARLRRRRAFSSAPRGEAGELLDEPISCGVRTKAPRRDIVRKPKNRFSVLEGMARRRRRRGPLLSSASAASSSSKAGP